MVIPEMAQMLGVSRMFAGITSGGLAATASNFAGLGDDLSIGFSWLTMMRSGGPDQGRSFNYRIKKHRTAGMKDRICRKFGPVMIQHEIYAAD
jgi:hypothetical protein